MEYDLAEEMPLNETDRAWIKQSVQAAIGDANRGVLNRFKAWSGPSITGALLIFTLTQWSQYVEFRTRTVDRLDNIDASIRNLSAPQAPRAVLNQLETLSPKQFALNLPALNAVTKTDVVLGKSSLGELKQIAHQLKQTNKDVVNYWPTTFRFINFATSQISPNVPVPHGQFYNFKLSNVSVLETMTNKIIEFDEGGISNITFVNCRIIFTSTKVRIRNCTFRDCVFDFEQAIEPTPFLKDAAQLILASNLNNVYLTSLG